MKYKIVIAEHISPYLEFLAQSLNGLGHTIIKAKDTREAIDLSAAHKPDIVIIDAFLPGQIPSYQASETIKELLHDVMIIGLTDYAKIQQKTLWKRFGGDFLLGAHEVKEGALIDLINSLS